MEIKDMIIMKDEFGKTPGSRYTKDGGFSGQKFLDELLRPRFENAVVNVYILLIDLDNVWGYPSSFVSGSFGKLSLEKGSDLLLKHIRFKSRDNPLREDIIIAEIKKPTKK